MNKPKIDKMHLGFDIAILLKAINAIIEIFCGFLLLISIDVSLHDRVLQIFDKQLSLDPSNMLINMLLNVTDGITTDIALSVALYLLWHGITKLSVVILLYKKKLWAYPVSMYLISFFVLYQLYKLTLYPTMTLLIVTMFDIIVLMLIFLEYKKLKRNAYSL